MPENDSLLQLYKKAETACEKYHFGIRVEDRGDYAWVTLPFYFPDSKEPLSLQMAQADAAVYVSDDGRAFDELSRRLPQKWIAERMARYFGRVQLECEPGHRHELVTGVRDARDLFRYLQTLSLIANADMYPTVDEDYFACYKKYATAGKLPCKGAAPTAFLNGLPEQIRVSCDQDRGVCVHAPFYFNDEPCPMDVGFRVMDEHRVIATDYGDFDGGRLYERMAWLNEDVHTHDGLIAAICARFGADYGDEQITYTFADEDATSLPRAYFTFLQLASVLGEIGHFVVPKREG